MSDGHEASAVQRGSVSSYTSRVGDSSWLSSMPETYDRCLGDPVFGPYAAEVARRAADLAPKRVLELAAGTGIGTAALVAALPNAEITATDLNPPMVAYAQERVPGPKWEVVDAQALPYSEVSFELVVCQFGVMFLPDRVAAYRGIRTVLRAGGSFLFTAWDTLDKHVVEAAVIDAMAELFPQDPPDFLRRVPHGYADSRRIRANLREAGFEQIEVESVALTGRAPSAVMLAEGYCLGTPLRFELAERGDPADVVEPLAAVLTDRFGAGEVGVEMSAHVALAARSSN